MKVLIDKFEIDQITMKRTKVGRQEVEAELLQDRGGSVLVRLPDGSEITRKKSRDIPTITEDPKNA